MVRRVGRREVYAAAERFVEESLKSDGSLFTPEMAIWTAENIEDLYERFVGNPDESSDNFETKFHRQLEGAPLETRQLAAELLYVYLLYPSNIRGNNKRRIISNVLEGTFVTVPENLERALDYGIGGFGTALTNRPWHLTMLLEFLREWKTMPNTERVLADPWTFKEIVFSVENYKARIECEALLHLVHPDTFERIASQYQKAGVAEHFSYLTSEDTEDVDRRILQIREGLAPKYGEGFDFYDEEIKKLWSPEESKWGIFVKWARKFYEWDGFNDNERDYKLVVSDRLAQTKNALLRGDDDWTAKLKRAFGPPNNLAHWRQSQPFLQWCEASTAGAGGALRVLWDGSAPVLQRIMAFSKLLPGDSVSGRGGRLALITVLLLAEDPYQNPVYRAGPFHTAKNLLDYPLAPNDLDEAGLYGNAIEFIDRFMKEAQTRGLELRDRLDAQSLIWCVAKWSANEEPVSAWDQSEQRAFLRYRDGVSDEESWWKPLESPIGLETELQRVIEKRIPSAVSSVLSAVFRRAILLHQNVGTDGFLDPNSPSIMTGRLFACTATRILYLLVDRDTHLIEPYDAGLSKQANDELMWLHCELLEPDLLSLLRDEEAWEAHERMLVKFPSISRARSNHLNKDKMSVITGKRLGAAESEKSETLESLADELYLDYGYLARVERLLEDKRQIIFYGPPGTGKTFVARRLARLYGEGSDGSSLLVQFHPSYSYEDFVEGYRPRSINGQPGFELVDGPLKKLASEARENPHSKYVVVVDEVNRANLTKVMGELYFLLEYRGESVTLQYSGEQFSLPENLRLICTMNTADRSIALVDAALRRRFYFAPFFPDETPIEDLLRRWLLARTPSLVWVADVVDEANRRLEDRDVAIGPSHFLRDDLTPEWVSIIWEHAVIPYLAEQMIDDEERLKEFDLNILRAATVPANPSEEQDEAPEAS